MKRNKKRSGVAVAMRKRFPRTQVMKHRAAKRVKDAKNHFSKDEVLVKELEQKIQDEVIDSVGINPSTDAVGLAASQFVKRYALNEIELAFLFEQVYDLGVDTGRDECDFSPEE